MRRKAGSLVPLETAICEVAVVLLQRGITQFHGYSIAKELKHAADTRSLTAYGTLYRALDRLEQMGFLRSELEDPHIAAAESRPGRRLYEITAAGQEVVAGEQKAAGKRRRPGAKAAKKGWSPT